MKRLIAGAAVAAALLFHGAAHADDANRAKYSAGDKRSGYLYSTPDTQTMQDDDFQNPGGAWVEEGGRLWSTADGGAGKSCQSCHGAAASTMKGIATGYPKFNPRLAKLIDIEQRINICRQRAMQAKPFPAESRELLALTAFIKNQSHGLPMNVAVDGPAASFFAEGKDAYERPRGQSGMSCASCHGDNEGHRQLDTVSQGQSNGFPTYRLSWETLGSVQRQFGICLKSMKAEALSPDTEEAVVLELYVAARGNGLPVETPSVRK